MAVKYVTKQSAENFTNRKIFGAFHLEVSFTPASKIYLIFVRSLNASY